MINCLIKLKQFPAISDLEFTSAFFITQINFKAPNYALVFLVRITNWKITFFNHVKENDQLASSTVQTDTMTLLFLF